MLKNNLMCNILNLVWFLFYSCHVHKDLSYALTQVELCWVYGLHKIQMKITMFYLDMRYIIPCLHLRIEVNFTFIKSTAFHVLFSTFTHRKVATLHTA